MNVASDLIEGLSGGTPSRWSELHWPTIRRHISRLQTRIVKAAYECVAGCLTVPYQGLSRVRGNSHARFLGGGAAATSPRYPPDSFSEDCCHAALQRFGGLRPQPDGRFGDDPRVHDGQSGRSPDAGEGLSSPKPSFVAACLTLPRLEGVTCARFALGAKHP